MISVKVKDENLKKALTQLDKKMGPSGKEEIFKLSSVQMYADVISHFEKEENEDGSRWERWKDPRTGKRVDERPYGRGGNKMLQDRGRLRNSLKPSADKEGAYVSSNLDYAPAQNFGNESKGIPAREFMWIDDSTIGKVEDIILKVVLS